MLVQLNTNEGVVGDDRMAHIVEAQIYDAIGHFQDEITRVEVYLSDANASKHGADDKVCVIEARAAGRPPVAASHQASSVEEALAVAAEKMQHRLEHDLGRKRHHKGGETIRTGFDMS